mgnify:FL=1|tara:strand:- start:1191 stop:1610 length:420 start_codon:yes stop_codon:yes gene_type:complete
MKRILKENMMRFGTKNLNEQGNSEFDPGGHYYVPQDDEITGTDIGDTKTIKNTAVLSIENNRCVFVVSVGANDNTVRLIPDGATLDYLANVSPGKIQDVLHKFCEQSTGIKFSPVYNDSGAGYAFEIDMYSVADKIKRN